MKQFVLFIMCMFLLSVSVQSQISGIPHKVTYQGVVKYLTSSYKTKYPKPGLYTLSFNFYEDSTTTLYSSGYSTEVVVGKNGVYTTTIGEDGTELGNMWLANKLLWLKVIVVTAPTKSGLPTLPYTIPGINQLTSVPYAYTAERAEQANSVSPIANLLAKSFSAIGDASPTIYGMSDAIGGIGVYGFNADNIGVFGSSGNIGVYGVTSTGTAVLGSSTASYGMLGLSVNNIGVSGMSTNDDGIYGQGYINGVKGISSGSDGTGVYGIANNGTLAYGIWGSSASGYAGWFSGKTHVSGTLSKSAGSFKIDHPLDPANKYLYHSFVESPDMKNIYDGTVFLDGSGQAEVKLPDWFGALNKDFRYQLTAIGSSAPDLHIAKEIENNRFTIAGGKPGGKVSWQVTGIRQDAYANAHRIPVEEEKVGKELGSYLHPELFGVSPELRLENVTHQKASRATELQIPKLPKVPTPEELNK